MKWDDILQQVVKIIEDVTGQVVQSTDSDLIVGDENVNFIEMLKILTRIQTYFQIEFTREELASEEIYTIKRLTDIIDQKIGGL